MTSPTADFNHVSEVLQATSPDPTTPIGMPESPEPDCPGLEELSSTLSADDEPSPAIPFPVINARAVKRKELSNDERRRVYGLLLLMSKDGKLKVTTMRQVADVFRLGMRTVQRIWKRGRDSGDYQFASGRVQNCGRKRVDFNLERIKDIPLRQRKTLRSLAAALGVSKSYLHVKLKEGVIKRHSNAIKQTLTDENMESRVKHCLASLDPVTVPHDPTFLNMQNVVHIDEKWFHLTKRSQTYYLFHDENEPVRTIRNANFIPKLMFLVAVARPRYDCNGCCTFDGKLGVFPLICSVAAARSSQNRPRGTIELKPIDKISREIMREFMIERVLPAIATKWPRNSITKQIFIQQDNAPTHIATDDVDFFNAVSVSGLNMTLSNQPPNSPDLNVLDLGFFRAIQSLQSKNCSNIMTALVDAVQQAFYAFCDRRANHVFITLQSCMIEVLKCGGNNTYKIPHLKKQRMERLGNIPPTLKCSPGLLSLHSFQHLHHE